MMAGMEATKLFLLYKSSEIQHQGDCFKGCASEALIETRWGDVGANAKTMGWLSQLRKDVMWGRWDSHVLGVTVKLCLSAKPSLTYSALRCGVGFANWFC